MIVLEEQKTKKKTKEMTRVGGKIGFKKNEEDAGKTDPEKEASYLPPEEDEGGRIKDWSDSTLEDARIGFGLGVLATLVVTGIVGLFKR